MGGHSAGGYFQDFGVFKFVGEGLAMVKSTKKPLSSKPKIAARPARNKKTAQGEADGPDERRPDTKADEIYGDTKIPRSQRK
jgi:hypothetical protein